MRALCKPPLLTFVALIAAGLSSAQNQTQTAPAPPPAKQEQKPEDWKPAVVPADALAYGAALEAAAPPKLKAWCENFAHKEMPKRRIDPRETMAVVDKQFPKNSDAARDAAIYLLDYLSYKEENRIQEQTAGLVRRLGDEIKTLEVGMENRQISQQKRLGSTRTSVSPQEMMHNDEQDRNDEQRIIELKDMLKQRTKEMNNSRKRVEGYLKVLGVTYPRMNGIEPSILQEFQ